MKRIVKYFVIVLILSGLLVIFLMSRFFNLENENYEIFFLSTYGDINLKKDQENVLSLAYIVKNDNHNYNEYISNINLLNDITFDNDNIEVSKFHIAKSIKTDIYTLYYLNLSLIVNSDMNINEEYLVNQIKMGTNVYDIGELRFRVVDNQKYTKEYLQITSASSLSYGLGLVDYFADLHNNSNSYITIKSIDFGKFVNCDAKAKFFTNYEKNDEATELKGDNITLQVDQNVRFKVIFENKTLKDPDVFYFAPVLKYEYDNNLYDIYFDYFASGLSINKEELKIICTKYKEKID